MGSFTCSIVIGMVRVLSGVVAEMFIGFQRVHTADLPQCYRQHGR